MGELHGRCRLRRRLPVFHDDQHDPPAPLTSWACTFTLDEPTQGSLGLRLSTGTGNLRRCIVFGGTVNRDAGSMGRGAGVFKASEAPPPLACP